MINLGPDDKKNTNSRLYEQRVYGTEKQKREQYDKLMGKTAVSTHRKPPARSSKDSHGGVIALMAVFMVLIFGCLIYLLFSGSEKKPGKTPNTNLTAAPTTAPTAVPETGYEYLAVILGVDTEIKTIKLYDVNEEIERTLVYTGSSLFYAEQGSQVTAAQLKPGDFMMISCDARQIIKSARWSGDTWEKLRIDDLEIQKDSHRMVIRGQYYKYSDDLCVMSDGKRVGIDALLPGEDKYTIRGEGDTVKEVIVTMGHGVLQLKNFEDFVDGEIMIGSRYTETVPSSGMFVVREGEYKVTISSGPFEGTTTVNIARGEETLLDVYEYGRGSIKVGEVNFKIEPFGAKLYINGNETDYLDGPVTLDFGSYFIEIQAGGYETQQTTLSVDSLNKSISIYLTELAENTPTPTPAAETPDNGNTEPGNTENGNTSENGNNGEAGNTQGNENNSETVDAGSSTVYDISGFGFNLDPSHRVYILGPEGGSITIADQKNGKVHLLGSIPCDFQKIIPKADDIIQLFISLNGRTYIFDYNETDDGADSFYNFASKFEE